MLLSIYANLENFYTLENDLGEIETSWFFIANIYLKIDFFLLRKHYIFCNRFLRCLSNGIVKKILFNKPTFWANNFSLKRMRLDPADSAKNVIIKNK